MTGHQLLLIIALYPVGNYMFKVNNRNTRANCEICSKLIVNFEQVNADWVNFPISTKTPIFQFFFERLIFKSRVKIDMFFQRAVS